MFQGNFYNINYTLSDKFYKTIYIRAKAQLVQLFGEALKMVVRTGYFSN